MDEVDGLPVEAGRELGEFVQARFVSAPIVGRAPVLGEAGEVVQGDATAPTDAGQRVWPAGALEARVEVVELGLVEVDAKGCDGSGAHKETLPGTSSSVPSIA